MPFDTYLYSNKHYTRTEEQVLGVMSDEYKPAYIIQKLLPHFNKDSIHVALVRLRHKGIVETHPKKQRRYYVDGKVLNNVRLWRKKTE